MWLKTLQQLRSGGARPGDEEMVEALQRVSLESGTSG